jgi:hypothetical protein
MKTGALIIASLLLSASSAAQQKQNFDPRNPGGRALLVGIDRYRNVSPTPGAVADAVETVAFIRDKYGFDAADIRVLTNEEATAEGIRREIEDWLIAGTRPGHRAFFFYAGHGTQAPDADGDETDDGMDEAIAPYDVTRDGKVWKNVILDDEFEDYLTRLTGRTVVMVFDSCHSGTISRGMSLGKTPSQGDGARYLPTPEQLDKLKTGTRGGGAGYVVDAAGSRSTGDSKSRDLKLFIPSKKVADHGGAVVISAGQAGDIAFPFRTNNGTLRGALSWAFAEEQKAASSLPLKELMGRVRDRIRDLQKSKVLKGEQVPSHQVSSPDLNDKPLFGSGQNVVIAAFGGANAQSKMKVSLRSRDGKSVFFEGEQLGFQVITNEPGYLYLLVFSQQGHASCIFPFGEVKDNNIPAGQYTFPPEGYDFEVEKPLGRDVAVALLAKSKLPLGDKPDYKYTWDEIFKTIKIDSLEQAVKGRTRAVGVKKSFGGVTDWQAATLPFETRPR